MERLKVKEVYRIIKNMIDSHIVVSVEDAGYTYKGFPVIMIWNFESHISIQVRKPDGSTPSFSAKPDAEWKM